MKNRAIRTSPTIIQISHPFKKLINAFSETAAVFTLFSEGVLPEGFTTVQITLSVLQYLKYSADPAAQVEPSHFNIF